MNYLKELNTLERADKMQNIIKRLMVLYGDVNTNDDIINLTAKILTQELLKKENLKEQDILAAYEEMANNYWKYRKFSGAGFLSALYEINGRVKETKLSDFQKKLKESNKKAMGL